MPRVISGKFKKKILKAPQGLKTRPTTDRVKEALFSSLESLMLKHNLHWHEITTLDLFAGSGQLGLETLSRGAKSVVFVDSNKEAHLIQKENIKSLKVEKECKAILSSVDKFFNLSVDKKFSLVLLDPPYVEVDQILLDLLNKIEPFLEKKALLVCEGPKLDDITCQEWENFCLINTRWSWLKTQNYGQCNLYFFSFVI